ncbi:MAG: hypothetical protein LBP86_01680, partial [Azoarcus sp.]|nr:hypothetical protein [Azoarcus sp.]
MLIELRLGGNRWRGRLLLPAFMDGGHPGDCFLRADQQIEAQREPPSLRGPKGRGNPVSRMDCHVASLLAMT